MEDEGDIIDLGDNDKKVEKKNIQVDNEILQDVEVDSAEARSSMTRKSNGASIDRMGDGVPNSGHVAEDF